MFVKLGWAFFHVALNSVVPNLLLGNKGNMIILSAVFLGTKQTIVQVIYILPISP